MESLMVQQTHVKKLIYVSALDGENLKHSKIFEAKEKFAEELKKSGIDYCVARPHCFFSDTWQGCTATTTKRSL
jgi:uncharacterized protein YbjT (DUF2867 family)